MTDSIDDPAVLGVLSALDDHDVGRAVDAFAPTGTFHEVPYEEVFAGTDIRAYFAEELFVSFPTTRSANATS